MNVETICQKIAAVLKTSTILLNELQFFFLSENL